MHSDFAEHQITMPDRKQDTASYTVEHSNGNIAVTIAVKKGNDVSAERVSPEPVTVEEVSTEGIVDVDRVQHQPVGYCIYCGAKDDLRREHIVPYALNGTAVLQAASCARCARITSVFERHVLRGPMWAARVYRKLRSRTRHVDAPDTQSIKLIRKGVPETIALPIHQYPILLHFPAFAPARVFTGRAGSGIELTGVASVLFGPTPEEVARQLGADTVVLESHDQPMAFARMVAKIGYVTGVASGAHDLLDGPSPVVASILGHADDVGDWVGTNPGPYQKYPGLLHRLRTYEHYGLLIAEVQLFADSAAPSYHVVLGRRRAA